MVYWEINGGMTSLVAENTVKPFANCSSLFLRLLNTLVLLHVPPSPPLLWHHLPRLLRTAIFPMTIALMVLLHSKISHNHYILKHSSNLSPSLIANQWTCLKKGSSPVYSSPGRVLRRMWTVRTCPSGHVLVCCHLRLCTVPRLQHQGLCNMCFLLGRLIQVPKWNFVA